MPTTGYRIRVHRALVTHVLFIGVPRRFAILNGVIGAALVLGMHAIFALPIFIAVHIAALILTKKDPDFFTVLARHLHFRKFYEV